MADYTVVDYSWSRPNPECLRAGGYVGVMRYLSWDRTGKNLDDTERRALHAAGLWIGINWEGTGNWTEFAGGAAAGKRAGLEAARQCDALGVPTNIPIFVSADYSAPQSHWAPIGQWIRAFRLASGRRAGFYGQGNLADHLLDTGVVDWIWQTNAWAWGGVTGRAVLTQAIGARVCGGDVDMNALNADPQPWVWAPNRPASEEDDMTPDQAKQLATAATQSTQAAEQAQAAAVSAAGALQWAILGGLNAIYQAELGRPIDAQGLTVWRDQINAGKTMAKVRAQIHASPEATRYRGEAAA